KTFFENDKTKNLEAAVSFNSENIFSDLRYFRRKNTNIYFHPAQWSLVEKESGNMSGLGLSAILKFWYLQVETQTSAYFANDNDLYHLPEVKFIGGLY